MLGSLGLNEQDIKDKGKFIGKETHLDEPCEHWELESRIEYQGKTHSQRLAACITEDGIQLWGKKDGQIFAQMLELERKPQAERYFAKPEGFTVLDMSKLLEVLDVGRK